MNSSTVKKVLALSGKSVAYPQHRSSQARAGKPAAGFFYSTPTAFVARPPFHAAALSQDDSARRVVVRAFQMPKTVTEIRSLARRHTRTALNVLVGVLRDADTTPAARIAAANAILERGWGKATQPLGNSEGGTVELTHKIERVIVHPENSDS
jgi:hypothetical protein